MSDSFVFSSLDLFKRSQMALFNRVLQMADLFDRAIHDSVSAIQSSYKQNMDDGRGEQLYRLGHSMGDFEAPRENTTKYVFYGGLLTVTILGGVVTVAKILTRASKVWTRVLDKLLAPFLVTSEKFVQTSRHVNMETPDEELIKHRVERVYYTSGSPIDIDPELMGLNDRASEVDYMSMLPLKSKRVPSEYSSRVSSVSVKSSRQLISSRRKHALSQEMSISSISSKHASTFQPYSNVKSGRHKISSKHRTHHQSSRQKVSTGAESNASVHSPRKLSRHALPTQKTPSKRKATIAKQRPRQIKPKKVSPVKSAKKDKVLLNRRWNQGQKRCSTRKQEDTALGNLENITTCHTATRITKQNHPKHGLRPHSQERSQQTKESKISASKRKSVKVPEAVAIRVSSSKVFQPVSKNGSEKPPKPHTVTSKGSRRSGSSRNVGKKQDSGKKADTRRCRTCKKIRKHIPRFEYSIFPNPLRSIPHVCRGSIFSFVPDDSMISMGQRYDMNKEMKVIPPRRTAPVDLKSLEGKGAFQPIAFSPEDTNANKSSLKCDNHSSNKVSNVLHLNPFSHENRNESSGQAKHTHRNFSQNISSRFQNRKNNIIPVSHIKSDLLNLNTDDKKPCIIKNVNIKHEDPHESDKRCTPNTIYTQNVKLELSKKNTLKKDELRTETTALPLNLDCNMRSFTNSKCGVKHDYWTRINSHKIKKRSRNDSKASLMLSEDFCQGQPLSNRYQSYRQYSRSRELWSKCKQRHKTYRHLKGPISERPLDFNEIIQGKEQEKTTRNSQRRTMGDENVDMVDAVTTACADCGVRSDRTGKKVTDNLRHEHQLENVDGSDNNTFYKPDKGNDYYPRVSPGNDKVNKIVNEDQESTFYRRCDKMRSYKHRHRHQPYSYLVKKKAGIFSSVVTKAREPFAIYKVTAHSCRKSLPQLEENVDNLENSLNLSKTEEDVASLELYQNSIKDSPQNKNNCSPSPDAKHRSKKTGEAEGHQSPSESQMPLLDKSLGTEMNGTEREDSSKTYVITTEKGLDDNETSLINQPSDEVGVSPKNKAPPLHRVGGRSLSWSTNVAEEKILTAMERSNGSIGNDNTITQSTPQVCEKMPQQCGHHSTDTNAAIQPCKKKLSWKKFVSRRRSVALPAKTTVYSRQRTEQSVITQLEQKTYAGLADKTLTNRQRKLPVPIRVAQTSPDQKTSTAVILMAPKSPNRTSDLMRQYTFYKESTQIMPETCLKSKVKEMHQTSPAKTSQSKTKTVDPKSPTTIFMSNYKESSPTKLGRFRYKEAEHTSCTRMSQVKLTKQNFTSPTMIAQTKYIEVDNASPQKAVKIRNKQLMTPKPRQTKQTSSESRYPYLDKAHSQQANVANLGTQTSDTSVASAGMQTSPCFSCSTCQKKKRVPVHGSRIPRYVKKPSFEKKVHGISKEIVSQDNSIAALGDRIEHPVCDFMPERCHLQEIKGHGDINEIPPICTTPEQDIRKKMQARLDSTRDLTQRQSILAQKQNIDDTVSTVKLSINQEEDANITTKTQNPYVSSKNDIEAKISRQRSFPFAVSESRESKPRDESISSSTSSSPTISHANKSWMLRPRWEDANVDELNKRVERALKLREELQMCRNNKNFQSAQEIIHTVLKSKSIVGQDRTKQTVTASSSKDSVDTSNNMDTNFNLTTQDSVKELPSENAPLQAELFPRPTTPQSDQGKLQKAMCDLSTKHNKRFYGEDPSNSTPSDKTDTKVTQTFHVNQRPHFEAISRSGEDSEDQCKRTPGIQSHIEATYSKEELVDSNKDARRIDLHTPKHKAATESCDTPMSRGTMYSQEDGRQVMELPRSNSPPIKISKTENFNQSDYPKLVGELVKALPQVPLSSFVEWFIETSHPDQFTSSDGSSSPDNGPDIKSTINNSASVSTDKTSSFIILRRNRTGGGILLTDKTQIQNLLTPDSRTTPDHHTLTNLSDNTGSLETEKMPMSVRNGKDKDDVKDGNENDDEDDDDEVEEDDNDDEGNDENDKNDEAITSSIGRIFLTNRKSADCVKDTPVDGDRRRIIIVRQSSPDIHSSKGPALT